MISLLIYLAVFVYLQASLTRFVEKAVGHVAADAVVRVLTQARHAILTLEDLRAAVEVGDDFHMLLSLGIPTGPAARLVRALRSDKAKESE